MDVDNVIASSSFSKGFVLLEAMVITCCVDDTTGVGDSLSLSDQSLSGPLSTALQKLSVKLVNALLRCVPSCSISPRYPVANEV